MLRLSGLDSLSMTDDQREAFVNMAENLGIDVDEAEEAIDLYLDEMDEIAAPPPPAAASPAQKNEMVSKEPEKAEPEPAGEEEPAPGNQRGCRTGAVHQFREFTRDADDFYSFLRSSSWAARRWMPRPNERPLTRVTLSRYYLSRYPVTNAEYEPLILPMRDVDRPVPAIGIRWFT